jgi:hypothetical protein
MSLRLALAELIPCAPEPLGKALELDQLLDPLARRELQVFPDLL